MIRPECRRARSSFNSHRTLAVMYWAGLYPLGPHNKEKGTGASEAAAPDDGMSATGQRVLASQAVRRASLARGLGSSQSRAHGSAPSPYRR
jgi:hypothetical protein